MKFNGLIPARLIGRKNRFVAQIDLNGTVVEAHIPTSGRLAELLVPGASVFLRPARTAVRKTAWDLVLVAHGPGWVSIDSLLPNRLARSAFSGGKPDIFPGILAVRPEVRIGASRIDFVLQDAHGGLRFVEVKSVTLVENGTAMFPDAPTARGRRHLEELAALCAEGHRAAVLFMIQRSDACRFRANHRTDPQFAETLQRVAGMGVEMLAYTCRVSPDGCDFARKVPVLMKNVDKLVDMGFNKKEESFNLIP